ncbi:hypothetical protein HPB50_016093 [Hyalomma asiaticum]|uniref:Uncharacterized protein n=1 Tax=Hyalomma asiaticum TaxID=266040 RepID=A0ACB7T147_HYAAI|nr:hypothetical protein HPB50_016093 [Hyalomma asiaticum]
MVDEIHVKPFFDYKAGNIAGVATNCSEAAHSADEFQKPVFPSSRDPKVSFLYDLLDWLDAWQKKNTNACRLTDETHGALYQTTQALVEITRYCFDELHLSFVVLGKFQTDLLEDRFGKYRRLLGLITTYLSGSYTKAKISFACKAPCHGLARPPQSTPTKTNTGRRFKNEQAHTKLTGTSL